MIQHMWSSENLTKVRKRADAKKIKVDSTIFYPATLKECAQVVSTGDHPSVGTYSTGAYYLGEKAFRSKSIIPQESDKAESRSVYLRRPQKNKDTSRDQTKIAATDSISTFI